MEKGFDRQREEYQEKSKDIIENVKKLLNGAIEALVNFNDKAQSLYYEVTELKSLYDQLDVLPETHENIKYQIGLLQKIDSNLDKIEKLAVAAQDLGEIVQVARAGLGKQLAALRKNLSAKYPSDN